MPSRADLDPADIPPLLPHLILTDVLGDGRYRFRLAGTEVEPGFGVRVTGKCPDEPMFGGYLAYVAGIYDRAVRDKPPLYTASRYGGADGTSPLRTERVALPLSDDGATVNIVMSAQVVQHAETFDGRTAYALQHAHDRRVLGPQRPGVDSGG